MFSVISLPVFVGFVFLLLMRQKNDKKQGVVGWSSMGVDSCKHTIYWRLQRSNVQHHKGHLKLQD